MRAPSNKSGVVPNAWDAAVVATLAEPREMGCQSDAATQVNTGLITRDLSVRYPTNGLPE